ncbi:MAG: hypothetical protein J2P58_06670 [Acidimicrobiaceae bacterium]|nr:hypothetical protein [Acidimicrobiaceae bacterium]
MAREEDNETSVDRIEFGELAVFFSITCTKASVVPAERIKVAIKPA